MSGLLVKEVFARVGLECQSAICYEEGALGMWAPLQVR